MSSQRKTNNKHLSKVYNSYAGIGQELQFLNSVFSFLSKKSSFLAKPGISKQVLQIVHNSIDAAKKQEIRQQKLNKPKKKTKQNNNNNSNSNNNDSKEMQIDANSNSKTKTETEIEAQTKKTDEVTTATTNTNTNKTEEELECDKNTAKWLKVDDTKEAAASNENDEDDDAPKGPAPIGNGGDTGTYVWTQTLSQLELSLPIDANLRGKNLNISIKRGSLLVCIRGKESEPIIDGKLHAAIDTSDSSWMLDQEYGNSSKTLTITLVKIAGMNWWSRVIIGDPEIDTKLIEPENSKLNDLDSDTRQTVEKMMFDQRQKMKGLPSSKELEQEQILERFKKQHPEMDFSNCKMGGGFGGGGFGGGGAGFPTGMN